MNFLQNGAAREKRQGSYLLRNPLSYANMCQVAKKARYKRKEGVFKPTNENRGDQRWPNVFLILD